MFGLFQRKVEGSGQPDASSALHAVLGTPIDLLPGPGQAEVLFGCGCFWGAEKGFWRLPGVITTAVGYAGGMLDNPSYQQVCSGQTGHAEVVRVVWDQERIHFCDLLKLFWECHDPTQGDRQGNDRGSQYRSAIYVDCSAHLTLAEASRSSYQEQLTAAGYPAITTDIRCTDSPSAHSPSAHSPSTTRFWFAELYHQQYLAKPGSRPYCSAQPTGQRLGAFAGSTYLLDPMVWGHYDWSVSHCVLRGDNTPIQLN